MNDEVKRILESVGDGIRTARERAGLRQWELAELAEMTQSEISLKERGKKDTQLGTVLEIFRLCGAEVRIGPRLVTRASEVYGIIGSTAMKQGIDNEQLAVMSGVGKTTLQDWSARSIDRAMISNVIRVCEALGQVMVVATPEAPQVGVRK